MTKSLETSFCPVEELSAESCGLDRESGRPSIMTIAEMARKTGVSPRALRFYESKGLLAPIRHASKRLYGPAEHQRLALLLRAKVLGFTLEEIRPMLDSPARQSPCSTSRVGNASSRSSFWSSASERLKMR